MKSWIIPNGCGLLYEGRLLLERVPGVLGGVLGLLANLPRGASDALALSLGLQVRVAGRPACLGLGPALAHLEPVAELVHEAHVAPPLKRGRPPAAPKGT